MSRTQLIGVGLVESADARDLGLMTMFSIALLQVIFPFQYAHTRNKDFSSEDDPRQLGKI